MFNACKSIKDKGVSNVCIQRNDIQRVEYFYFYEYACTHPLIY